GLTFQFTGTTLEAFLLGRQVLLPFGGLWFQPSAQPFTELKIGQEQQADEIERSEDNRRADVAEMSEQVMVQHESEPAAGAGRAEVGTDPIQETSGARREGIVVCVQIEKAHTTEQQHGRPDPAAVEIG